MAFAAGVRGACGARGAAFGCCLSTAFGAEFLARTQPCGTGAAQSGIVVASTIIGCDVDKAVKSYAAEKVKQLASFKILASSTSLPF